MSSQDELGISFSISHEQENFRLLELPPPLLELVASNNPPILYLKSAVPDTSEAGGAVPNAVLCTNDETFEVRQIQSSNSLYILQPSHAVPQDGSNSSYLDDSGMSVIARCKAILEVVHLSTSLVPYLKRRLPTYVISQSEDLSGGVTIEGRSVNLQTLLEDVPFSKGELEKGLIELCAVEISDQIWLPLAQTLLLAWKSFMTAATVKGTDVRSNFPISEMCTLVEEDGFPHPLLVALLRKLSSKSDASHLGYITLDRDKTVQWVGATIMEAQYHSAGIALSSFMKLWQDLLPESWRKLAVVEALAGDITWRDENTIAMRGGPDETAKPSDAIPVPKVSKGPSRWHDKFKKTKQ